MTLICPHHPFSLYLNVVPKSTTMTTWILSLSLSVLLFCGQGFGITYEVSSYAVNWCEAQHVLLSPMQPFYHIHFTVSLSKVLFGTWNDYGQDQ